MAVSLSVQAAKGFGVAGHEVCFLYGLAYEEDLVFVFLLLQRFLIGGDVRTLLQESRIGVSALWCCMDHTAPEGQKGYSHYEEE